MEVLIASKLSFFIKKQFKGKSSIFDKHLVFKIMRYDKKYDCIYSSYYPWTMTPIIVDNCKLLSDANAKLIHGMKRVIFMENNWFIIKVEPTN